MILMLGGCVRITGVYLDPTLPAASASDVRPASHPTPVQIVVDFHAGNDPKVQATAQWEARLLNTARSSGLFTNVSADPVEGGRRLVVNIDDYGDFSKGGAVVTGVTAGLVGNQAVDHYHCEVRYEIPGRAPVSLSYEHALTSTIGAASGPPGLKPYPLNVAVTMLIDQIDWSIMRDLGARGATEE